MVVLQHEQLHSVLWGPASRDGRTKRSDVVVFVQLALVAALAVKQFYEYDKPAAARLAACGVTLLLYFRNVALFIRLIILLSFLALYGDVFVPAKRVLGLGETFSTHHIPIVMYAAFVYNNAKIVYLVLGAMPKKSRKTAVPRMSRLQKPKAA